MAEITEEDRHRPDGFVCQCDGCIETRAQVAGFNLRQIDREIVAAAMAVNRAWEVPTLPTESELARLHFACIQRDLAIEVGKQPVGSS